MKFKESTIASTPEILKRKLGGELIVPVTIASTEFASGACKAGSPIDATGKVANTADAIGILLNDVTADDPNGALVKAFAVVNEANANANAGITISSAAKGALPNIIFE